ERWLLKTIKALATSKNLGRGRLPLSGVFASDVRVLDMLDDPKRWSDGAGLYCVMNTGDLMENHNRFQIQPYTNEKDEISGLAVSIMGLVFVLMLEPPNVAKNPEFNSAKYRPGEIFLSSPFSANRIAISWSDGRLHSDSLRLQFLRKVKQ